MKEIRYTCLAVNYLEEINDEHGKNLDELKEEMLEKFTPKVYSRSDIDKMSSVIGFDLWKGMIWCDYEIWQKEDWKTCIGLKYRLIGFEDIIGEQIQKQILNHINYLDFYSLFDIQNIESILGLHVFDLSKWQSFSEIFRHYSDQNLQFHYFSRLLIHD